MIDFYEQHLTTLRQTTGLSRFELEPLFGVRIHVAIDPALAENRTHLRTFGTIVCILTRLFPRTSFDAVSAHDPLLILPWGADARPSITDEPAIRVVVGTGKADVAGFGSDWQVRVNVGGLLKPDEPWNPVLAIVTACYMAAATTKVVFGDRICGRTEFGPFSILDFNTAVADFDWDAPFAIGHVHLGGVGAIGSGFLYTLAAHGTATGELLPADHDRLDRTNLGRYIFFDAGDVGEPKVTRAKRRLAAHVPALVVTPICERLEAHAEHVFAEIGSFRMEQLVSCPDKRPTRRDWQALLPRHMYDASTGPSEVVLHANSFDPDLACTECVYPEDPQEHAHDQHVADLLNVSLARVQSGVITEADLPAIQARYPELTAEELVGRAFDSVFRRLCGDGDLRVGDHVVLAPLPFTSVLAGALLYLEFVRRRNINAFGMPTANYARLASTHVPNPAFRRMRPSSPRCRCQDARFRALHQRLWLSPGAA